MLGLSLSLTGTTRWVAVSLPPLLPFPTPTPTPTPTPAPVPIVVSNDAQLASALAAATGGELIQLAPGNYSAISISNRTFNAPVRVTAQNVASMPVIGGQSLISMCENVVLDALDFFHSTLTYGAGGQLLYLFGGSKNVVRNCRLHGIAAVYAPAPLASTVLGPVGLRFEGTTDTLIEKNRFDHLSFAVSKRTSGCTRTILQDNEFTQNQYDSMFINGDGAVDCSILRNYSHHPLGAAKSTNHTDAGFQLYQATAGAVSSGWKIIANVFDGDGGPACQVFQIGNEFKNGWPGMIVTDNFSYSRGYVGLNIDGVIDGQVRRNIILTDLGATRTADFDGLINARLWLNSALTGTIVDGNICEEFITLTTDQSGGTIPVGTINNGFTFTNNLTLSRNPYSDKNVLRLFPGIDQVGTRDIRNYRLPNTGFLAGKVPLWMIDDSVARPAIGAAIGAVLGAETLLAPNAAGAISTSGAYFETTANSVRFNRANSSFLWFSFNDPIPPGWTVKVEFDFAFASGLMDFGVAPTQALNSGLVVLLDNVNVTGHYEFTYTNDTGVPMYLGGKGGGANVTNDYTLSNLSRKRISHAETTAPTILTPAAGTVAEDAPYTVTLRSNQAVTWAKGSGDDTDAFGLSGATLTLSAKDFENPTDVGANNTYVARLIANNESGLSTSFVHTLTVTDVTDVASHAGQVVAGAVFEHRASDFVSGQIIANKVAAPADGSTQTGYDLYFGTASATESTDPSFVAAAGGVPAYFGNSGSQRFETVSTAPAFLNNLGNTQAFTFVGEYKAPASWGTGLSTLFRVGANVGSEPGFKLEYDGTNNRLRIGISSGTTLTAYPTGTGATVALPTSGNFLLFVKFDPNTDELSFEVKSSSAPATFAKVALSGALSGTASGLKGRFFQVPVADAGLFGQMMWNKVTTASEDTAIASYVASKHGVTV